MTSKKQTVWGNVATFAITVLVVLAIAEIVLRAMPSLIGVPVLERMPPDLRAGIAERLGLPTAAARVRFSSVERSDGGPDFYLYKPDWPHVSPIDPEDEARGAVLSVPLDDKGYCNPPEMAGRPHVDVIFLGDSFPFCSSIMPEDTAAVQIERMTGISIYNLAIAGIGPYEYLEILKRDGLTLSPKVVLLNIYEGNDLRDLERYVDFLAGDAPPCGKKCRTGGGPMSWSYALAFLVAGIEETGHAIGKIARDDFRYTVTTFDGKVAVNVNNGDQDEVAFGRRIAAGEIGPELFGPPLEAFAALARERGFVPIVAYIPSAHTAYIDSVEFEDPDVGAAAQRLSKAQREWLAANADRLGVAYVDLVPAFRAAAPTHSLTHFPSNVHLTPSGQRVMAEALAPVIERALGQQ
jgi:hypothetical protein